MSRRERPSPQTKVDRAVPSDPPPVVFHPHAVEVTTRPEGYREFRCIPATWSYPEARPFCALLTEFYSGRMAVDPYGTGVDSEFWSGSDAALRLRALPADDLALRELAALASRRSIGINTPKPWASRPEVKDMSRAWEPEATDVHFSQYPGDEKRVSIWAHYGMEQSFAEPVIFSYGMRKSERPPLGNSGCVWAGGPGTWYAWATLLGWDRWPRRQESQQLAAEAKDGRLLLFVSHRWQSLDHPDPSGAQLLCLKVGLTLALAAAVQRLNGEGKNERTVSGLPELIAEFIEHAFESAEAIALPLRQWARDVKAAAKRVKKEDTFWAKAQQLEALGVRPLL
jgi:hypothetical protein